MKRILLLCLVSFCLQGCTTLYCTRIGGEKFEHTWMSGPKNEEFYLELELSGPETKLRGKRIPDDVSRVKITFYPFRPIHGVSIWPLFGYHFEDYSGKYNDGSPF